MSKKNPDLIDISEYDLDKPPDFDSGFYRKQKQVHEARAKEDMSKRRCLNPECSWEEMVPNSLRFCPVCDWQIKGWESKAEREKGG